MIGSKVLGWLEHALETLAHWNGPLFLGPGCSRILYRRQESIYGFVLAGIAILGFGAAQNPGVIFFALRNQREPDKMKGLIITSSILFLLDAGCWGLMRVR